MAITASALAGLSWIAVLSSLNVAAQTALPDWVRARGLAVFLTVFFGSMSFGSLIWGQVAPLWGIPTALLVAAVGILLLIPATALAKLSKGAGVDIAAMGGSCAGTHLIQSSSPRSGIKPPGSTISAITCGSQRMIVGCRRLWQLFRWTKPNQI